MDIGTFLSESGLTPKWLADKTGYSEITVRCIRRGARKVTPRAFVRFQWAARGALRPDACGLDAQKLNLPDFTLLPDPHEIGVTWEKDCAPFLPAYKRPAARARGKRAAHPQPDGEAT